MFGGPMVGRGGARPGGWTFRGVTQGWGASSSAPSGLSVVAITVLCQHLLGGGQAGCPRRQHRAEKQRAKLWGEVGVRRGLCPSPCTQAHPCPSQTFL